MIGGWAVYAHNPYQQSIDIDLIYQHGVNIEGIVDELNWVPTESQETQGRILRYVKRFDEQPLYLDLLSSENSNLFREDNTRSLPFSLALENQNKVTRTVEGMSVNVPKKELLIAYKIKAYRDRRRRVGSEDLPEQEVARLQGKMTKDLTDIIALLDPQFEPVDREALHTLLTTHNIEFAFTTLQELTSLPAEVIGGYRGSTLIQVRSWIELLT